MPSRKLSKPHNLCETPSTLIRRSTSSSGYRLEVEESQGVSAERSPTFCFCLGNLIRVNQIALRLITICADSCKFPGFLRWEFAIT